MNDNQNPYGGQPPYQEQNQPPQNGPQPPYQMPQPNGGQQPPPYQQPNGQRPVYTPAVKQDNTKLFSILAYIPFLWLIGLLVDRKNPVVTYHVNQGIIFTIFSVALSVAVSILTTLFSWILPAFVIISALLNVAVGLVTLAYFIIGVVNAANGDQKPLPIIGTLFTVVQ